jgi:hypothetical protein
MLSIYRVRVFNKYSTLSEVYILIITEYFSTSTELILGTIFHTRGATWLAVHEITRAVFHIAITHLFSSNSSMMVAPS